MKNNYCALELLRKTAEQTLMDMVQLLASRYVGYSHYRLNFDQMNEPINAAR